MAKQKSTTDIEGTKEEFLAGLPLEQLKLVARQIYGIQDISHDASRDEVLERLEGANTAKVQYAKTVKFGEGEEIECPVGYAVVRMARKSVSENGQLGSETFFLNCHGDWIAGRRGIPQCIREKFLGVLNDAVYLDYYQKDAGVNPATGQAFPLVETRVPAEEYSVLFHNPDTVARERAERELRENSAIYMREKQALKASRSAFLDILKG